MKKKISLKKPDEIIKLSTVWHLQQNYTQTQQSLTTVYQCAICHANISHPKPTAIY